MTQNNVGIYASQISGHLWSPNGAYDALATVTVPSGGVASVEFSGIPQGYKHLQVRWMAKMSAAGLVTGINLRLNNDSGANYKRHALYGEGAAPSPYAVNGSDAWMGFIPRADSANTFGVGITDILDYASTTKNKTIRTLNGQDQNGSGNVGIFSTLYFATPSAISSIIFYPDSANFTQYSTFALYGVK